MHAWRFRFRRILLLLLLLIVLLLGYIWFTAPPDPLYDGERLSEHLKIYYGRQPIILRRGQAASQEEMDEVRMRLEKARFVLQNLDERSLPLLRAWLKRPPPSWAPKAADLLNRAGVSSFSLAFNHQYAACEAVRWNPEHSVRLLPELRDCFNSPDWHGRAAAFGAFNAILHNPGARSALFQAGDPPVSDLLDDLRAGTPEDAFYSAGLLWAACKQNRVPTPENLIRDLIELSRQRNDDQFPAAHSFILPSSAHMYSMIPLRSGLRTTTYLYQSIMLIDPDWHHRHLLTLEFGPEADRVGAAWALGKETIAPEKAVPLLIANLSSTNRALVENAAMALGKYGPSAKPALPHLSNLLTHAKAAIRIASSNAITMIQSGTPH